MLYYTFIIQCDLSVLQTTLFVVANMNHDLSTMIIINVDGK